MKKGALLINVARAHIVDKQVAGKLTLPFIVQLSSCNVTQILMSDHCCSDEQLDLVHI